MARSGTCPLLRVGYNAGDTKVRRSTMKHTRFLVTLLLLVAATAVLIVVLVTTNSRRGQRLEDIPTPANIDTLATAVILTENAPPAGFAEVRFPKIDANLSSLPGWRYIVTLQFDGVFAGTPRETSASAQAEVWFNQLGSARRVVVSTSGELLGREEPVNYEAVRLGPDAFLVEDGVCMSNAGDDARTAADLSAGDLIGGVNHAVVGGRKATLNGLPSWFYIFTPDELNIPAIQLEEGGTLAMSGELWVAPEHNAVTRYYATLDVTNARIFGRQLPVDGRIIIRYDLYDVGTAFNITQPFGC